MCVCPRFVTVVVVSTLERRVHPGGVHATADRHAQERGRLESHDRGVQDGLDQVRARLDQDPPEKTQLQGDTTWVSRERRKLNMLQVPE